MPNHDLYKKTFPIPDHVAKLVGRSGSLSYTNMKKIASELNAKEDKSTYDFKFLKWVESELGTERDAIDGVKRIKMDTDTDGDKNSVTGKGNNFKVGTTKDKAKKPTAIGGLPDITTMTKPRNIFNNKMDYIKHENVLNTDKMRYLMEYMEYEKKDCVTSQDKFISVCKYPDDTYKVTLFKSRAYAKDIIEPFFMSRKVSLNDLESEVMSYYTYTLGGDPKPEDIQLANRVINKIKELIKKLE